MPSKRAAESEGESDYDYIKDEQAGTPPSTPKSKTKQATKKTKPTPSPTKSTTSSSSSADKSPKAIFGEMIVLAGISTLSKAEIYAAVSQSCPSTSGLADVSRLGSVLSSRRTC